MIETNGTVFSNIKNEISMAIEKLGGSIELLCAVGSWGDTQDDADILEALQQYNEAGTYMGTIICQVGDTPETKRDRFKVVE